MSFQVKGTGSATGLPRWAVEEREEIARQVAIAREAMRRYTPAMRELAR
jgi:hypothetical protein